MRKPYWDQFRQEIDKADIDQIRDVIDDLFEEIEELQKVAHPPLGQDQIYDRLEKLEEEMRSLRNKSPRSTG